MQKEEVRDKISTMLERLDKIVLFYRRQEFFKGSMELSQFLSDLNLVVTMLFQWEEIQIDKKNILMLLEALLGAQEKQDYILMADILEDDILSALHKVQVELGNCCTWKNEWEHNMQALAVCNEPLYHELTEKMPEEEEGYAVTTALDGQPTLAIERDGSMVFMHSSINPSKEAKLLLDAYGEAEHYTVYGFGLGYHVKEMLERNQKSSVVVLENDLEVLRLAFTYTDWAKYLESRRLQIVYHKNLQELLKTLGQYRTEEFLIHYPSLQRVHDSNMKEVLEDFFVTTSSMREQGGMLQKNFVQNQKYNLPECEELKHIVSGRRVVLVAAGPSVDEELERLREIRDTVCIIAVAHVAAKLIQNHIFPDIIVLSDPQEHMYQQIENLPTREIPLILLSTASEKVVSHYDGQVYLAYQKGFEKAEKVAREKNYLLFETGGSVSTLALDIAIRFEATEIIFVGLDLAYTNNQSHADGIGRTIADTANLRKVESVTGAEVYTSRNLDIYRKWVERRIAREGVIHFINTSHGARIHGTIETKL